MMHYFLISSFILLFHCASAQNKLYSIKKSEFSFFSTAPLEDIEAKNTRANSIINTSNRELVVRIPVSQFQFRNKLMQQHFNENYMESEKYPYATFKGKINEELDFSKAGVYSVSASGTLNIHGVDQDRKLSGKLTVGENSMLLETKFEVLLIDHKIEIPKLVFKKIAEKIEVTASINYIPYIK
ncbi:MAG: YceI family protein [Pedobacter sp.]|jgi:hypothetical protein